MLVKDSCHITYCTNIHPGQDWKRTYESLQQFLPGIKAQLCPDAHFGVGLRLSNRASMELGLGARLQEFREWLAAHGLYVFTMNGFPYGNFHNERVKDLVHAPDWSSPERLQYTKRLFEQLAYLLPPGQNGGISTSPVSYKHWHSAPGMKHQAFEAAAGQMGQIVVQLHRIEQTQGKYLHLDIEPEPDGLIENSSELLAFFHDYLEKVASPYVARTLSVSNSEAKKLIYRHITACYDICHFSLAFEAPQDTFKRFEEAGIRVGKIQVSAALKVLFEGGNRERIWSSLARFDEPTYLHQVTELKNGVVTTYPDLPAVLRSKSVHTELRAHFHVPIFLDRFEELYSTQDQILEVMSYIREHPVSDHLEVETYTWEVLPPTLKKPLSDSIVRELQWLKAQLQ